MFSRYTSPCRWDTTTTTVAVAVTVIEVGLIIRTIRRGPYAHHDQPEYRRATPVTLVPAE